MLVDRLDQWCKIPSGINKEYVWITQVRLLRNAMEESGKRRFLIDGFPRNLENLNVWLEVRPCRACRAVLC
jgi:hypothetical protein